MSKNVLVQVVDSTTILSSKIKIPAPSLEVWEVLKYPGNIDRFHPLVKKSFITSAHVNGMGAKRHCGLIPMGAMDEIVTEWVEGHSFTMEVVDGKMLPPYKFMGGKLEIRAVHSYTEVQFTFSYRLRFSVLGRLMDMLLIRPQFKKAPPAYLEGLKNYIEKKGT